MSEFIVNIIHRPELAPEYAEKVTGSGRKENIGRADLRDESLDIFRFQQETAHKNGLKTTIQMTYASMFSDEAVALAKEHQLYVIEDACQAIGAQYTFANGQTKQAGTIGDIGCTSFFPSKNLGCYGDGGAIFTNDDALAERMRAIANHGCHVRYHHDEVGVNSRLDSIQAAILDAKLPHLNEYIAARQRAAAYYDKAFAGCEQILVPAHQQHSTHVFHQYTLRVVGADRDKLREGLAEAGIPAMIYYPVPLHQQKAYRDPRYQDGDFPVAEKLASCVLSLPMHTELDEEQLEYIASNVLELI